MKRKLLSFLMCAVMVVSMLPVMAVSAAKSPKDIDKIVIDMRSEAAFANSGGKAYIHNGGATEADIEHSGKFSFNAEKQALQLIYSPDTRGRNSGSPFHFMTYVNQSKALNEDYKYMVIVYQAKTSSAYDINLWNTPGIGTNVNFATGAKDTAGKWVVSEPGDISVLANGGSILGRWAASTANNCLYVKTTDKDMEFYIKEYSFFKSAEDAKDYYAQVDLAKNPIEYMSAAQKKANYVATVGSDGKSLTNNGEGLYPVTHVEYTLEDYGLVEDTEDEEFVGEVPAPVIMDTSSLLAISNSGAYQTDHQGNTEGSFNYVTLDDGTKCIRLNYSVPDTGNWARYRMMPAFQKANTVTKDHKYMRITYMTPDVMTATITVTNNVESSKPITLVEDTSVSMGKWVTSNAINIQGAGVLQRYIDAKHCTIGYTAVTENAVIYIKEIAFFATKEQAYDYYGDGETTTGTGMSVMTFTSSGTGTSVDNGGYGNYTRNEATGAIDITYAEKTGHGVNYMVQVKFINKEYIDNTHRYARVL